MSARSSMRQSFNEWMASQGYNDMDDVFLEAKIEEYVRAARAQTERENERLRAELEGAKKFGDIQLAEKRALEAALQRIAGMSHNHEMWLVARNALDALTEPTPPAPGGGRGGEA